MTTVLIIGSLVLLAAGLLGCIVPGLPGPPVSYAALWLLQWAMHPFSPVFLAGWAAVTLVVVALDYYLPVWTAKRFGATRLGIIGSVVGMIAGMFFTPVGMLGGLVVGAVLGDMMAGRSRRDAARSGMATFFGTLFSIGIKLVASGAMTLMAVGALFAQEG